MTWRKAHGTGAKHGRLVAIETLPPDEQPWATPSTPARPQRDARGRFVRGNTTGRLARIRPGKLAGLGLDRADPAVCPFLAWGRRYAAARRGELAQAHGGELSAGVGALVESAGLALAASRYLHAKAAETGDPTLFSRSARLAESARQHELAAWELGSREAAARPPSPQATPWLVQSAQEPVDASDNHEGSQAHPEDERRSTRRSGATTAADDEPDDEADEDGDDE